MGAWEDLVAGNFFNSVVSPYTSLIGEPVFYSILWFIILGIMMIRSKSLPLVGVTMMITSFVFVPKILPASQLWLVTITIVVMIYVMYDVFKSGR